MVFAIMENLSLINNPQLRNYAKIYTNIYNSFLLDISKEGIPIAPPVSDAHNQIRESAENGLQERNCGKSLCLNWISSACEACQKGIDSATFFISLNCHRNCFFCFNPNQEDHDYYLSHKRDCLAELDSYYKKGQKLTHIALTGGEPLLFKKETVEFFKYARLKFPRAHTRLYTSGDLLDEETLTSLKDAQLNEIRFSVKMEDTPELRQKVLTKMTLAKEYIRDIVVEMPAIPGQEAEMKELLLSLDQLGITGINLLELCYPFNNKEEFIQRSLEIKNPPYQTLYNYWYAGGLPIAGSEDLCLELIRFAAEKRLTLGIHYCSLENKHTGQVFQQNSGETQKMMYFSPHDYFLKSAKVFGDDIPKVLKVFKKKKIEYRLNETYNYLEFSVKDIKHLKGLDVEIAISSNIMENRPEGKVMRELKIELTYPDQFDLQMI